MRHGTLAAVALGSIALAGAAAYLRDPPWLVDVSSGFGRWHRDPGGRAYRWTGGHASFFVPAEARVVRIPLRRSGPEGDPVIVRIDLDDRPASLVALRDASWRDVAVRLPPGAGRGRRAVRVDLRASRTFGPRSLGIQVGRIRIDGEPGDRPPATAAPPSRTPGR